MATEGHIDVGSTAVQLDTTLVTQSTASGAREVHREVVALGDPSDRAAYATITRGPSSTDYGVVIKGTEVKEIADTLERILVTLERIETHLPIITNFTDS